MTASVWNRLRGYHGFNGWMALNIDGNVRPVCSPTRWLVGHQAATGAGASAGGCRFRRLPTLLLLASLLTTDDDFDRRAHRQT